MAATNPVRYLLHLGWVFPVVTAVDKSGVTKPGAWTAAGVERRLDWPLPHVDSIEEGPAPRDESLAAIWRALIPERAPSAGPGSHEPTGSGPPAERAGAKPS